jgi:anti-sigma B factor antagonist
MTKISGVFSSIPRVGAPSSVLSPVRARAQGDLPVLKCAIVELKEAVVVQLHGEIDLAAALSFRECLDEGAKQQKPILLDMTNLQYFDTSGARVIEAFFPYAREHAGPIAIISPAATIRRGLQLMGVDRQIPIFGSVDDGLAWLRTPPSGSSEDPGDSRTVL